MIYLFKQKINVTPYSKRDAMVNNWQNLYHRLRNTGAEGKIVMFLDSNTRNFSPDNLVCVTRQEVGVMAALGHNKDMTREEREVILLRAKLSIERSRILGQKKAQALHNKMNYENVKNDPEHIAKRKKYARDRRARIKADPIRHEEYLRRQRENRRKRKL